MKQWLDNIRKPNKDIKISKKIIYSLLIILLGIILGVFSKWLDNLPINDEIWWQHILGLLDLRNVFSYVGIWYFYLKSIIDFIIFIGTILVLNVKPKNTIYSLIIGFVLVFLSCAIL